MSFYPKAKSAKDAALFLQASEMLKVAERTSARWIKVIVFSVCVRAYSI